MTSPFDLLEGQRYMRLTTFRRSGEVERAQNAYLKAREIDARMSGLKEALAAGRETARPAPPQEPGAPRALRRSR